MLCHMYVRWAGHIFAYCADIDVSVPPGRGSHKSPTLQGFCGPSPGRLWTITRTLWTTTRALWTTNTDHLLVAHPDIVHKGPHHVTPPHRRRYPKIMIFPSCMLYTSADCSCYYAIMQFNSFQNK